jgi:RHS repeat-associated protein
MRKANTIGTIVNLAASHPQGKIVDGEAINFEPQEEPSGPGNLESNLADFSNQFVESEDKGEDKGFFERFWDKQKEENQRIRDLEITKDDWVLCEIPIGPGSWAKVGQRLPELAKKGKQVIKKGKQAWEMIKSRRKRPPANDGPIFNPVGQDGVRIESKKTQTPAEDKAREIKNSDEVATTGDPVNAVTGEVVLTQSDFALPGRIALDWSRRYGSNVAYSGLLGPGWQTPADARLVLEDNLVVFYDGGTGAAVFEKLPGDTPVMEAANGATLATIAEGWQVILKSGMRYQFCQPLVNDNDQTPVARISDSFDNSLSFVRDDGQLSAIVDSSGRRIDITCEDGRIAQMRHQDRLLVRYEYRKGRLVAAVDPTGHTRRYDYDNGRLIMHRNRNQLCFRYHYDAQGRCTRAFGDKGLYDYRFEYLPLEPCTRVTDSLGHVWHYYRDKDNLPTQVVDPTGAATCYAYDRPGRLVAVTDALERTTRYDYDAAGNVVKITRPDQSTLRFVYNARHRPIEITDPGGGFITQRFDDHGQLIEKSGLLDHATRYQYSPGGDLIAVTDPLERTTRFEWDKHGQLAGITRPSGNCTHYQYDPAGCLTAVIDPDGGASTYSYDEKGRLVAAVSPGGLRRGFEYDAEDNLLLYTDAAGHQTRFAYSGLNKLSRRTNADGTHIEYHYDSEERLTGLTNEKGQTYGFAHDPAGRIMARTDFYGQTHHYTFDPAGQLIQSTDPLQQTIDYTYDRLGRLTQKRFADERCETFTRDPSGRLTAFESPDIRIQRYHDGQGRLICEYSDDFSVKYDYDPAGQCIARGTNLGNSVKYDYDPDGNVQSIAINDAAPVQIQRDRLGRITGEQLSARFLRTRGYDEEGRLTTQHIESPLVFIDRAYSFDPAGNLIEKQDSAKGTHKFGYDPMGRITAALDPMKKVHHFSYDPAGDLLNHLPENQTDLRRATFQGGAYHFDAAGNLTRRQLNGATLDLSWDEQNRLRAVEGPDTQPVTMGYDALGRRCHKTVGDRQTLFAWDGDALIAERTGNHDREYVYYPGSFEPLAVIDADKQLYYYHNDINGLPQELTCPEGRIVWSARYDAVGRLQGLRVDEVAQPLRLQGQYWDQEIGLCYNRYRYFDPHICSFISQDPIGLAGGENVYAYAPNVWTWVDPLGLCADDASKKGTFPDEIFSSKASDQVTPGTGVLEGQHIDDLGRVQPWEAHYDEYGRLVGRTDYNAANSAHNIPDVHHHTYEWGPGKTPMESGSHIPGEYKP